MGDYNRNNRSDRGRSGGGGFRRRNSGGVNRSGGGFRGRDSGRREMHKAVCDECGRDCEVPFRPSGEKPIYCSDCFERREEGGSRRSDRRGSGGSGFGQKDNTHKKLLETANSINSKLDRILKVIESGTDAKLIAAKTKVKKKDIEVVIKSKKTKTKKANKKESKSPTP